MKRVPTITVLTVLILAAAAPALAQKPRGKAAPPPPKEIVVIAPVERVPVNQGRLEGDTYSNDFFGLSFSVAPGWVAVDHTTRKSIQKEGMEVIAEGASEKKKAQLDAAMARVFVLLNVSKYDVNTPRPEFNALLSCIAERVPTAVIKTGGDYIAASLRAFNGMNAKAEVVGRLRTETVGGLPFTVADIKVTAGPRVIAQRYHVRLVKGHALVFIFAYMDEEDLKAYNGMIRSVKFK